MIQRLGLLAWVFPVIVHVSRRLALLDYLYLRRRGYLDVAYPAIYAHLASHAHRLSLIHRNGGLREVMCVLFPDHDAHSA